MTRTKQKPQTIYFDLDHQLYQQLKDWCRSHKRVPLRQFVESGVELMLALPDEAIGLLLISRGHEEIFRTIGQRVEAALAVKKLAGEDSREDGARA